VVVGLEVGVDEPPEADAHCADLLSHDLPVQSRLEDVAPPSERTAITITAATKKTTTEYSTAVAPRSFLSALPIPRPAMGSVSGSELDDTMMRLRQIIPTFLT
jgi:hypothetical protein